MSKLTLDERAEVKMDFRNLDPKKEDIISRADFKLALHTMFFDPSDDEINSWCPNDTIDYESYKKVATSLIQKRQQTNEIKRMFRLFDRDKDGYISFKDLQQSCKMCGDKSSEMFIKKMINDFDSNKRGKICERDFISIFGY